MGRWRPEFEVCRSDRAGGADRDGARRLPPACEQAAWRRWIEAGTQRPLATAAGGPIGLDRLRDGFLFP